MDRVNVNEHVGVLDSSLGSFFVIVMVHDVAGCWLHDVDVASGVPPPSWYVPRNEWHAKVQEGTRRRTGNKGVVSRSERERRIALLGEGNLNPRFGGKYYVPYGSARARPLNLQTRVCHHHHSK